MLDDTTRLESARHGLMPLRIEPESVSSSVQQTAAPVDDQVMSLFFPARAMAPHALHPDWYVAPMATRRPDAVDPWLAGGGAAPPLGPEPAGS